MCLFNDKLENIWESFFSVQQKIVKISEVYKKNYSIKYIPSKMTFL